MASAIVAAIPTPGSPASADSATQPLANRTAAATFARALDRAATRDAPTLVTAVRTRLDSGQASEALAAAWTRITGEAPSPETLRVLTAQWAHETGNGASMFNYNFGGIKGAGPSGLSVAQRTREGYGESERRIVDNFRAYRTAEEGATDYVRLLSRRFPEAVEAAKDGDPVSFVDGLKTRGYFTGDPVAYTRSIVRLSGIEPSSYGAVSPPPVLEAAPLSGIGARTELAVAAPLALDPAPLIDAMALADEISRAALRIAAATNTKDKRG